MRKWLGHSPLHQSTMHDLINDPSKLTRSRFPIWHPWSVRLRASNEASQFLYTSRQGSGRGCPLLRASDEHSFIVRVLRARRAPGRSLPIPLAVIGKLQINPKIFAPKARHGRLEIILALTLHAHLLALNLRLYFQF